jgi:hypothetical protein
MKPQPLTRRRFLATAGASSALATFPLHAAEPVAAARMTSGLVDCQSHLFFPEVLDMMRKRQAEPLVYDHEGTAFLKMGDWLRKVPPAYVSVEAKLAAMDASGIAITLLSNNDPGPEWFSDDGPAVAHVIHDSLAGVRSSGTRPLREEARVRRHPALHQPRGRLVRRTAVSLALRPRGGTRRAHPPASGQAHDHRTGEGLRVDQHVGEHVREHNRHGPHHCQRFARQASEAQARLPASRFLAMSYFR